MVIIYPQNNDFPASDPASLDYDLQDEKQRIAEATEEIKKELLEAWNNRYRNAQIFPDSLSYTNPELIDFLLSFSHTLFYNKLAREFSLDQQQRDVLPQVIWKICISKNWEQLASLLKNDLTLSATITDQVIPLLEQNILTKAKELSQKSFTPQNTEKEPVKNKPEHLNIHEALKEYPELGEQLITSNRVELKNFPEPVRPSIKNWLADYTFNLGNRKHNSMERNTYVFHENNAKSLNSYDRQKLTCILRSFDEDSLVFVNKNTKQVVFEKENPEPERKIFNKIQNAQITNSQPVALVKEPGGNIRTDSNLKFSFPQKLPYETMQLKQSAPPIAKKLNPIVRIPKEEKKDERILGKNVVNLKE